MTQPPERDISVGMKAYASRGPPCPSKARTKEEDFRVEEVISLESVTSEAREGFFPLYKVEKRSIDTFHMEREISEALRSRVSYGGLKDKRAVTLQYVTPTSSRSERPERIRRDDFSATLIGYVPHPMSRGSVIGNRFQVILRDSCSTVEANIEETFRLAAEGRVPNYFGHQRFGTAGVGTHMLGRALVRRKFEEAIDLLLLRPRSDDSEQTKAAREAMAKGELKAGYGLLPPTQDIERSVARRLADDPEDLVGGLRGVPLKLRRLFVHAYQSYIFNETLSLALAGGLDISVAEMGDNWVELKEGGLVASEVETARAIPSARSAPVVQMAGYSYRDYGSRFDRLTSLAMQGEGVAPRDFYIKEMQEASAEGGFRIAHMNVAEPSHGISGSATQLRFTLARGQYATVLLREIIKPHDPREAGLA